MLIIYKVIEKLILFKNADNEVCFVFNILVYYRMCKSSFIRWSTNYP